MSILRDIKIIEAILFASGEPVSEDDLKDKIVKNRPREKRRGQNQKNHVFWHP